MAADPKLPRAQTSVDQQGGLITPEWYRFFQQLLLAAREAGILPGVIEGILARLSELEQASEQSFLIQGLVSVQVLGTPANGLVQLQLLGDVDAPGNTYYYGTGPTGTKGWFAVADGLDNGDGIDLSVGSDGVTEISFNADTAEVAHLPGATYKTVQKVIDVMLSPGIITGGEVTELTSTSVRITGGTAVVRIADDNVSELRFFDFPSQDFSVPDVQVTHFYALDYNGGSPVMVESLSSESWDRDTEIPLGSAVRGDGFLNVTPNPYRTGDVITNLIQRLDAIGPVQRDNSVGGLALGETGTRNVTVSAGRLWARVSDFNIAAKNSSVEPMSTVFFNGTNLTVTSGITQWDNQNYNDIGTGTLVPLGNNKWANLWFFMSFNGDHYGFAYGTGEHNSLGDAANEGVPSYLTQNFFNQFILLGRFIFQESAATAGSIESAFESVFNVQAVNTHNDLGGLQGGTVGELYHFTNAEHTFLASVGSAATFDERAQDAVGNNLLDTATVNLTYNDATGQISADASLMLWGGATSSPPAAGVKLISQNNTQSQLFEVITTDSGGGTVGPDICSTEYADAGGGGIFHMRRARGTLSSPTAVQAGDIVGGISGRAYHSGGAFQTSGPVSIHWVASENQTSTAYGSYMRFYSTPKGSTTRVERLVLTDVGAIWSLGSGTFDPKDANQTSPFGGSTHRFLASGVNEAVRITSIGYGSSAAAQFNLAHANGTPSAPTAVESGDQLGLISAIGYTGASWVSCGLFRFQASENWTGSANGTDLVFETTADGSTTRTERLRLKGDGRLYGTALHNNSGSVTGTTEQYIASGTYTPTLTNTTNIASSTAFVCQWIRVGNVVTVSGRVIIDPTAVGLIQLGVSLPIASNLTAVEQVGGTGASNNEFIRFYADAGNDRATAESIIKTDTASAGFHFSFTYLIA